MSGTVIIGGEGHSKQRPLASLLTSDQVDQIAEALNENLEESPSLKVVADLPSNNGVEVHEREIGFEEKANVTIDSVTGSTLPCPEKNDDTVGMDFDDLVDQAIKNLDESETKVDITEEDIEDQIKKNTEYFKDLDISREGIIQILRVVQRVQNKEEFNIFKALPIEVQQRLNKYLAVNGMGGYSVEANTTRNTLADILINEFIQNISLDKFNLNFQKEMEELENKVNKEFSKMYLDYSEQREQYVQSIMEGETDPVKKEAIGRILDSIHDGYALERIKEAAGRIKIKNYDLENPKRAFDIILNKYRNSTYNIYSVFTAYNTLKRHMRHYATENQILGFFVVICKFCQNYHPTDPTEHAFMYYAMYNPILLDVYKGDEYDKFFEGYRKNVLEVIEHMKSKPAFSQRAMRNIENEVKREQQAPNFTDRPELKNKHPEGRGLTNPCIFTYDDANMESGGGDNG